MHRISIAAAGLVLSIGAANAASSTASTVDNIQSSPSRNLPSPGTVGAMTRVAQGVATYAGDVRRQQDGTSLDGTSSARMNGHSVTRQSPGTVGASPGSDQHD